MPSKKTSSSKKSVVSIRLAKGSSRASKSSTKPASSLSVVQADDLKINEANEPGNFDFLRLPLELRNSVYQMVFSAAPQVIDLDPLTFYVLHRNKLLAIFAVSHQLYEEATHQFFSTRTFRLFPTHPGRYLKAKKPLIARLPSRYRASITTLELRLGPNWTSPPEGWVVNKVLGLEDCVNARFLKIFVECDPSDPIFNGFRKSEGFYENFSQNLLDDILNALPSIKIVEFDAWPSVKKAGNMISGLERVVARHGKVVGWGAERGWDEDDKTSLDAIMKHHGGASVYRALAIHA